ncbi:endopeptidase La [Longibacter salinarum]|uniref:Lon protease n=1 Tax=Longibacter salinarum TaxID=1850348 RepID=A0A2A8CZT5_9BACT|nr:endopeptidase La [Longibacter salinarum]PEN14097.1 endopeptidase La [Longibacter salinarum]
MNENELFDLLDDDEGPNDLEQQIPLPTPDEEVKMKQSEVPDELPILVLRNTVLFPGVVLPITVGRDASLQLVREAFEDDRLIGVVAQKSADIDKPDPGDLYPVGTVAEILKLIKMPDGSRSIVIQGKRRIAVEEYTQQEPYFRAKVNALESSADSEDVEIQARIRSIKELAIQIVHKAPNLPSEAADAIENIESPAFLIHFIASNLQADVSRKQDILSASDLVERADLVLKQLQEELQVLELSEEIRTRVRSDVDEQQREYLLRQQLKAIQEELGDGEGDAEIQELRKRARKKDLPEEARETLNRELDRLARTNPAAPDYAVTRNYVDWILDLPWNTYSEDQLDISHAETVLDEDHYGLEDVKERILEYLAVLKLKGDMKAPILCLHGPPGVGKTSLGQSIARALDREFVRMSLGGVRDEAEIRGHRRTYVGALPGRVLQGLKKAGTNNPVFMLDEVDKLDSGFRGDPSSALLEVLDPEQNDQFNDHYLELDYDLSKVLFVATANYVDRIPAPLRDRMEMIEITGYTQNEKLQIAKQYLVPRQVERNGLNDEKIKFEDDAISLMIDGYTRESGVRQLERTIGAVTRGVAKKVATDDAVTADIHDDDLEEYLGARKYFSEVAERTEVPGVATGLAWTPTGGDILFIEASLSKGQGRMTLTGQLGDVMKESGQAALSYVKARSDELGIPQDAFRYWDLHVHVPAGAVPKDGPSAGITMISALVSAYTQRRVKHTVAMTGEITLRGLVLPVGGIKEKVLAAKRAGINQVILPKKNEKDVKEITGEALDGIDVTYVERVDQVIDLVLEDEQIEDPAEFFALPESEKQIIQQNNRSGVMDEPSVN